MRKGNFCHIYISSELIYLLLCNGKVKFTFVLSALFVFSIFLFVALKCDSWFSYNKILLKQNVIDGLGSHMIYNRITARGI